MAEIPLINLSQMMFHAALQNEKPGIQAISATGEDRPPIPRTDKNSTHQR